MSPARYRTANPFEDRLEVSEPAVSGLTGDAALRVVDDGHGWYDAPGGLVRPQGSMPDTRVAGPEAGGTAGHTCPEVRRDI